MAQIIDGKAVAAKVREEVKREVEAMDRRPGLATILVGDDPASAVYVRMKREDSAEVGIESFHHEPGGDVAPEELAELIRSLNADERVDGILLQLPLPDALDQDEFISLIDPAKDVDGLTTANAGLLMHGREEAMVPCTPAGVMRLLEEAGVELSGARAVVLGRSILVGKPMAQLLLGANATVTHCHSRTRDLPAVCREADVLVAAVGSPGPRDRRHGRRGSRGDRRGHEPHGRRPGRRRGLRGRTGAGPSHHPGAGRSRPDDARDAAREHAQGRPRPRRLITGGGTANPTIIHGCAPLGKVPWR